MNLARRREWTREELIVAFNRYCRIPFGRIHNRNPSVIQLAKAIGRTPSALSWKLANFARLDPTLKKRNIAGATHGAQSEIEVWNEFASNWEKLAFESERLLQKMLGNGLESSPAIPRRETGERKKKCFGNGSERSGFDRHGFFVPPASSRPVCFSR